MKDSKFSQRGEHKAFIAMIIALILLAFVFLFFAREMAFQKLEENTPTRQNILALRLSDEMFVDVLFANTKIVAEVAKSKEKKAKGLSNIQNLEDGKGMLFVFEELGFQPFWNKETYIPLDILWIKDDAVVHMLEGLPVYDGSNTMREYPPQKANYVLEVKHGFVKENSIKLGDKVLIK